jgi:RNA polymerase sigma-70 factor (ECF subfamily)
MGLLSLSEGREQQLLEAWRRDDVSAREASFRELVAHFERPLLRLATHLTGSPTEAPDVAQEVLLALHRALPSFRGEARLSTFVYRIALRAAAQHRALRPRGVASSADDEVWREMIDPGVPPDRQAAAREELRRMLAAMSQLSLEHRSVLSLSVIEGLGHARIAEVLGIPEGTVWSRLHLARRKLVAALQERNMPPDM